MAKIARYNGNLKAFASESQGTERTIYGDVTQSNDLTANINADYLRGLAAGLDAAGQPTEEDFNGALFTVSQLSAYLHQMGVAEWSGSQEYHIGSIVNRSGVLYVCKTNNLINATEPESDSTNWKKAGSDDFVALTGNQTIAGVKTFSSSPVVPTATTSGQAVNLGQVIGVGQTWQDVTASRALGVTYTNSTGKPIMLKIRGSTGGSGSGEIGIVTDGIGLYTGTVKALDFFDASAIVPHGSTYKLTVTNLLTITEFQLWAELR